MLSSHESLKNDYQASCAELDTLVDLAMAQQGVWGSRAMGAGLGAGPDAARKAPGSTGVAEAVDSDRRGEALNDDCDRRGTGQNYIDYRAYFP